MNVDYEKILSIDDFPTICVACLAPGNRGRAQLQAINLEYLQDLLGAEYSLNDPDAPHQLCLGCFRLCQRWNEFRSTFRINFGKLKVILDAQKSPAATLHEEADAAVGEVKLEPSETFEVIPYDLPDDEALFDNEEMEVLDEVLEEEGDDDNDGGDADYNEGDDDDDEDEEEEGDQPPIPKKEGDSSAAPLPDTFDLLYLECALCNDKISHYQAYNQHLVDVHMEGSSGVCSACTDNPTFDSEDSFRQHIYTHTPKFKFNCPECPTKLNSRNNLRTHLRLTHQRTTNFDFRQCHICGEQVSSAHGLRVHILEAHIPPDHTECFICFAKQPTDRLLARHLVSHGYSKPHRHCCEVCGMFFLNTPLLKVHLQKHQAPAPRFKCDFCGKSYGSERYLETHKMTHTAEKTFKCDECGKLYYTLAKLKTHLRTHAEGNRSYICSYCGRGFFNTSVREEHIRIRHTNDRRYPCDQCDRRYFRRRELEEHQRKHTGEKPFKCEVCGKLYQRKTTLMTHMKTHRGEQKKVE